MNLSEARLLTLRVALLGMTCLLFAGLVKPPYRLLYNPSLSAPRGWYVLGQPGELDRGSFAVVNLPGGPGRLADRRGYKPFTVPLLKRVAAVSGQWVCEEDGDVQIDGEPLARARSRDGAGRPLSAWSGCRVLQAGELFLLSRDSGSFDSRYFGPVDRTQVIGRAVRLWTW
jgi:conjugative transfer signal peptidase TraF